MLTHDQLAGPKHQRVLERLVLALGDRADHDPRVLPDPELSRADEVADVLDHQQVDLLERDLRDRRADHVGVEVALPSEAGVGVDLGDRDVQMGDPVGVEAALHVALEDADPGPFQARFDSALQKCRLAGSGGAHHVDDGDLGEVLAVGAGDRLVGVECVLGDPDPRPVHHLLLSAGPWAPAIESSTSIHSTSSSPPARTSPAPPQSAQANEVNDGDRPSPGSGP